MHLSNIIISMMVSIHLSVFLQGLLYLGIVAATVWLAAAKLCST